MPNELKPEDVTRAIECCLQADGAPACYKLGCPARMGNGLCYYETDCEFGSEEEALKKMLSDALALIRGNEAILEMGAETIERQDKEIAEKDAEIERLRKAKYIYSTVDYCADDLAKAREKIERLKADNKDLVDLCHLLNHSLEEERSIVIDEFAHRLKKFYGKLGGKTVGGSVEYHIDQIAKEMKGDQDA